MEVSKELVDKIINKSEGHVESIILDQWRTSESQWSLTYGYSNCDNECENCGVYKATIFPEIKNDYPIRTVQVLATLEDRMNYGDQRALNCKTIDQYVNGFITCFTSGYTLESIDEELSYVAGFKLIYLKGVSNLEMAEKEIKRNIVKGVLSEIEEGSKCNFVEKAKKFGLI